MGSEDCRVLVVATDTRESAALMGALGSCPGLVVRRVRSLAEARTARGTPSEDPDPEFVVAARDLPDGRATDLIDPVGAAPPTPLLVLLPAPDPVAARDALDRGALDALYPSDLVPEALDRALARARSAWRAAAARRTAEAELREERNRLELVSRTLGVGLVTISRDYRTLWANSVVTETFGDVVGRPCYEAYQRRDRVCPDCGARQIFESGADRVVHDQLHVDARGNPVWFEVVAAPLHAADEPVQTVMELGLPADARKKAEQALRESEARYRALSEEFRAILDAIPDTLVQLSPELEILWANRGAGRGMGCEAGDLVGRRCHEVWHCRASPCEECPVRASLRSGRAEQLCALTPDDRAWELRAVPVRDEAGAVRAAVEVARDVTEQRRAVLEREALVRELESKNALLEQFVHTVSHDLKGPLTAVRGIVGLLERALEGGRVERAQDCAGRIRSAADWMQRLLDALLAFSRSGAAALAFEPLPLNEVVRDVLDAHATQFAERDVQVTVDPGLPVVRGDRVALREVFENLVGNAVKFLGDQPHPRIEIGQRPGPRGPVFFVRDNGRGLEPGHRERVFGLFQRLDPRTEGTGVGLAIVRRVVEAHGGRVWVESDGLGTGSAFCLTLGAEAPGAEGKGEPEADRGPSRSAAPS